MRPAIKLVDFRTQQESLLHYPDKVIDQLWDFGNLMITESQQRSAQLDSKLGAYLAYGAALIALLGIGQTQAGGSTVEKVLVAISLSSAVVAVAAAMFGLRSQEWASPSEVDWFRKEFLGDANKLRRFHISALLQAHQFQQENNALKAGTMRLSEWTITGSAIFAAGVICLKLFTSS